MMGIYIKGIEMPKEPDEMIELAIFGDGKTLKTGESWRSPVDGKCYYGTSEDMNTYSAFAVHPHGRLIDADAVIDLVMQYCPDDDGVCSKAGADLRELLDEIENLPTVIPATEAEEET